VQTEGSQKGATEQSATVDQQRDRYQAIYSTDSDVWLYPRTAGLHTVLLALLGGDLAGKRVLDVGCGAGRLALLCARADAQVVGIDISTSAVALATLAAQSSGVSGVTFRAGEARLADGAFDLILLAGVAEHLPDPLATLGRLAERLRPDGQMVLACPGFSNPRGWSYRTVGELLGWPMSLADLRQVDRPMVEGWCDALGLRCTRVAGALYRGVWGPGAVRDMVKRLPPAARDGKHAGPLDVDAYGRWFGAELRLGSELLALWERQGLIAQAPVLPPLQVQVPAGADERLSARLQTYLALDDRGDTSFSESAPVSELGGEVIYWVQRS
jgi:SAM-dependent methyltransferase